MGNVAKWYRAALWPRRSRVRTPPFPLKEFEEDLVNSFHSRGYLFLTPKSAYFLVRTKVKELTRLYGVKLKHCTFLFLPDSGEGYVHVSFGAPVNKEYYFKIS